MKKIKNKLVKWFGLSSIFAVVIATTTIFANNINIVNQYSNTESSHYNQKSTRDVNYSLKSNPIVDLGTQFSDLYFSTLNFELGSLATENQITTSIKNILKNQSYWEKNIVPTNLDIKIEETIQNYKNPKLSNPTPAARIVPVVDGKSLDPIVVSLIGFKEMPTEPTYAIDTVNKNFSSTNKTASFILTDVLSDISTAPSSTDIKAYLFKNNYNVINSIFANLPEIAKNTNSNSGQFVLGESDININLSGSNAGTIIKNYKIFDYTIDFKFTFIESNGYITTDQNNSTFNLKVYVPTNTSAQKPSTIVSNAIKVTGTDANQSAYEFDQLRNNNPNEFKNKIIELLKTNSSNFVNDITPQEIDVRIAATSSNYYNNASGYVIYSVVIKKVKYEGNLYFDEDHFITQDIIFSGFKKITQTKYLSTITVTDSTLSSKYASEYSSSGDILADIVNVGKPLVYYQGSYSNNIGQGVATLFKAEAVSDINYKSASYNDNTGTISNITLSVRGYYDGNGIYKNSQSDAQLLTLNITGFKTSNVNGQTVLNTIDAPSTYSNYPAQSFAALNSEINKLSTGWLPTNTNNLTNQEKINEIKDLIALNTSNLPDLNGNEKTHWKLKDVTINNLNGSVSGKVFFPYYYEINSFNEPVIKNQSTITAIDEQYWFDFEIQGFSQVDSATNINNSFSTERIITKDAFDVIQQVPTSTITISDFKTNYIDNTQLGYDYKTETIKYWVNQGSILSNLWPTFNQQFNNSEVGLQDVTYSINIKDNIFTISFKTYIFDANGTFKLSDPISIIIRNFKEDVNLNKPSSILVDYPLPSSQIKDLNLWYAEDLANCINDKAFNAPTGSTITNKQQALDAISDAITSKLAENVNLTNNKPVYKITNATYDYNTDPKQIVIDVQFIKNYNDSNGNFVSVEKVDPTIYKVKITGLQMKSNTNISPIIDVSDSFSEMLASEASKDGSYSNNIVSGTHIDKIKQIIKNNVINPANPQVGIDDLIIFENQKVDIGNTSYFGDVNDINGTINLNIKFKANQWVKDGQIQANESETYQITLTGFKKQENASEKWYLDQINLNTSNMVSNENNNIASAVKFDNEDVNLATQQPTMLEPKTIKKNLKNALINSNLIDKSLIDFNENNFDIKMTKNTPDNANGSVVLSLSLYGDNVYDPETGLIYNDASAPYKFEVLVTGFLKVKPTVYNNLVYLDNISDIVPPSSANEIKNQISSESNISHIFANTLPPGFSINFLDNIKKYIFIPSATDNFEVNYSTGEVRVKKIGLGYFFDSNYQLVCNQFDSTATDLPTNDPNNPSYLLIEDIVFSGYKRMEATEIISSVTFAEYSQYTASEFYENIINTDIVRGIIYNNPNDINQGTSDLPTINNISKFIKNYSIYVSDLPKMEVDKSTVQIDNITGTITFKLKLTGNYFKINNNKLEFIRDNGNLESVVTVSGFKQISATSITSRINISDLANSDPSLVTDRLNLFWYNETNQTDSNIIDPFISTKFKLMRLILENHSSIIKNSYEIDELLSISPESDPNASELENQKAYLDKMSSFITIEDFNYESSNFATGNLTVKISLKQYVKANGTIVDVDLENNEWTETPSDPNSNPKPLESTINIYGFSISPATTPKNAGSDVRININMFDSLKDMPFYATKQELQDHLKNTGLDSNNNSLLISSLFSNVPPSNIFKFVDENDQLVGISDIKITNHITGTNPQIIGEFQLNNILVENNINGETQTIIGSKVFNFIIEGFVSNVETSIESEWNLSLKYSDYISGFGDISTNEGLLKGFNQIVSSTKEKLWVDFVINPVRDTSNNVISNIKFENISVVPSEGKVIADVIITNVYDNSGVIQSTGTIKKQVTILGFDIQPPTSITSLNFNLQTDFSITEDILPSELKYGDNTTNNVNKLISLFNNQSVLNKLLLNPVIGTSGDIVTNIVKMDIISVDDGAGSVKIKLWFDNYYNTAGNIQKDDPNSYLSSSEILITGLSYVELTSIGKTKVDLDQYFGNLPLPTIPSNFPNLTPTEYIKEIDRALSIYGQNESLAKFNELFEPFIRPVYLGPLRATTNPTTLTAAKTNDRETNIISAGIINPGKIITQKANGSQFTPTVSNEQRLDTIKTAIDYHLSVSSDGTTYNVSDIIRPNDRLGELSITLLVSGFWTLKYNSDSQDNILEMNDSTNVRSINLSLFGGTTHGTLQKDTKNDTNLAQIAIIAISASAAAIALVFLIVFILKLLRFGTGGS